MDFKVQNRATHDTASPPIAQKTSRRKMPRVSHRPKWWKIVVAIILIAGVAWLVNGYITTKHQLDQLSAGGASSLSQSQQLINKVGNLVALPTGENPTIATVNDASKLKSQVFFANAKDGDKVLIYSKSGMAVLYRPSTNRVIEYSTVDLNGTGQ